MSLYTWEHTNYASRTWKIDFLGSGTPDDLLVRQWPSLEFTANPEEKEAGVFTREVRTPIHDRPGSRGLLTDRLLTEDIEVEVSLDGSVVFTGYAFVEGVRHEIKQATYDASVTVTDGLNKLKNVNNKIGTLTFKELLREILNSTGLHLPIDVYTDWIPNGVFGSMPDNFRISNMKDNDDSYFDVLEKFCYTFGFQLFQWNNRWVLRQPSVFYAGTSETVFHINTSGGITSEFFNANGAIEDSLDNGYEDSAIDIVEGYGAARSAFDFPENNSYINTGFSGHDGDSVNGWNQDGITHITRSDDSDLDNFLTNLGRDDSKFNAYVVLNEAADRAWQSVPTVVQTEGDVVNVSTMAVIEDNISNVDHEGDVIEIGWLKIKLIDGDDGVVYYIGGDGQASTSEQWVTAPQTRIFRSEGANYYILEYSISFQISGVIGIPFNFSGKTEIEIQGTAENVTDDTPVAISDSAVKIYVGQANVSFEKNSVVYDKVMAQAEAGSLDGVKDIELSIYNNNQQFALFALEHYDGVEWVPSLTFNDGYTFGVKRSRDFIRFNDKHLRVIEINHDYGTIHDVNKVYTFEGHEYLPVFANIELGLDDVEIKMIEHEETGNTVVTSEEFSFSGSQGEQVTSTGGGGSGNNTGGGGSTGISQAEADSRYFNEDANLSEGDPATMRGNLGFNLTDGAILKGGANNSVLDSNLTESQINTHLNATDNPHDTSFNNIIGSINDAQVPQTAVTQHQGALTITESQISDFGDYIPLSQKGSANGVSTLDGGGKIPASQLPNSIMQYKGTWNADTNTPELSDGTGNVGDVYRCTDAGTVDFGSGSITFEVGSYAIYNASGEWERSGSTDGVSSVFGRTGDVSAQSGDYLFSQISGSLASGQLPTSAVQENDDITRLNNNAGYLTSESDTLYSVTQRGATANTKITITGNDFEDLLRITDGGDYLDFYPYGIETNRGTLYFRSVNDDTDTLQIGNSGGNQGYAQINLDAAAVSLRTGTSVNEIVTSISSPTDDQLATALGVKNYVDINTLSNPLTADLNANDFDLYNVTSLFFGNKNNDNNAFADITGFKGMELGIVRSIDNTKWRMLRLWADGSKAGVQLSGENGNHDLPTIDPGNYGQLYRDSNGFVKISI